LIFEIVHCRQTSASWPMLSLHPSDAIRERGKPV